MNNQVAPTDPSSYIEVLRKKG